MLSAPYLYVAHLNFYGIEVVLGEVFARALFRRGDTGVHRKGMMWTRCRIAASALARFGVMADAW